MKRKGSVFLEAVFYIAFCTVVLLITYTIVFESLLVYKGTLMKNDLRENAVLSENIIKNELCKVKGLKLYKDENVKNEFQKEGYYNIKKIEYDVIDYGKGAVNENEEGYPKFKINHKKIEKMMNNLYVGHDSKYQIM